METINNLENLENLDIDDIIINGEKITLDSLDSSYNNPYTSIDSNAWATIKHPDTLTLEDKDGEIEITAQEIRRIREILKEQFPEDYI